MGDDTERPMHGHVWRHSSSGRRFSVMHVCHHHDPPRVTGYWHRGEELDPELHGSIPLPAFMDCMEWDENPDSVRHHHECI